MLSAASLSFQKGAHRYEASRDSFLNVISGMCQEALSESCAGMAADNRRVNKIGPLCVTEQQMLRKHSAERSVTQGTGAAEHGAIQAQCVSPS